MNKLKRKMERCTMKELDALEGLLDLKFPQEYINIDYDSTIEPTACWICFNKNEAYVIFIYDLDNYTTFTNVNIISHNYIEYDVIHKQRLKKIANIVKKKVYYNDFIYKIKRNENNFIEDIENIENINPKLIKYSNPIKDIFNYFNF